MKRACDQALFFSATDRAHRPANSPFYRPRLTAAAESAKLTQGACMAKGTIHRTIKLLQDALDQLNAPIPLQEQEAAGVMVNRAMSAQERSFHTPEHIFDLVEPGNPHMILAALFHDIVYFQVDQGFTDEIGSIVTPYILIDDGTISLIEKPDPIDRAFWGCASIFGFEPGQVLSPFAGLNEFLSALVMDRLFVGKVPDRDLLITTACIEATIPFRGKGKDGLGPADSLEVRVRRTNDSFKLGMSEEEVAGAVRSAVAFANKDVRNFAENNVGRFLDNTWKLLPETNPSLRMTGIFSIGSYRVALQKMEGFLSFLDPDTIFCRYRDTPPEDEFREIVDLGHRNVGIAREYLGIKLLTAAILEALAEISGGDAPISLFMGDINAEDKGGKISDYLPEATIDPDRPIEQTLYDLLALGRASASSFDLRNSPLSLYIYLRLGTDGFHTYLGEAKRMFGGEIDAAGFLKSLPDGLITDVARACGEMAFTRKASLQTFVGG